jgi:hypothetical protein
MSGWIVRVTVLVSAFFLSNRVWAASVQFYEAPDGVGIVCEIFTAGGFSVNGGASLGCSGLNASGSETINESVGEFSFSGGWYYGPGYVFTTGSNTVYFVDSNNEVTSILNYTFTNDADAEDGYITGTLQFDNSGAESLGTPPGGATAIVQDGTDYAMTGNPYFAGEVDTTADPTSTPEPASIALLLSGLFGIRLIRRRRD